MFYEFIISIALKKFYPEIYLFSIALIRIYYCSVALPQGIMGWSAVCECGISSSYSLTFYIR